MTQYLYSTDLHTVVAPEGAVAAISLSPFSLHRMEEIVDLLLSEPGKEVRRGEMYGGVDVMTALIAIPSPLSGTTLVANPKVLENHDLSKDDPLGEGLLLKMRLADPSELPTLLSFEEYEARAREW